MSTWLCAIYMSAVCVLVCVYLGSPCVFNNLFVLLCQEFCFVCVMHLAAFVLINVSLFMSCCVCGSHTIAHYSSVAKTKVLLAMCLMFRVQLSFSRIPVFCWPCVWCGGLFMCLNQGCQINVFRVFGCVCRG